MSDIGAVVLYKILENKDLHGWSRLKLAFLDQSYISLYNAINSYYNRYGNLPSFQELEATSSRNPTLSNAIKALENTDIHEDIDIDVAIDVLIDTYTQNHTLTLLDKFVDSITLMTTQEVKDSLSEIVIDLDEKTHTSETVVNMSDILLFSSDIVYENARFPTGINNTFDSTLGGAYRQELILIGGKRGSGKSVVCNNFVTNQFEMGNSSVYFTIEMTAKETFERSMAILSNVPYMSIKQNNLSFDETLKLVKTRASMFTEADESIKQFIEHRDRLKFESELVKNFKLKDNNQMIIVDDRELSITAIDLHLQKLKSRFGDKLTIAVIDYLNQIVTGTQNTSSMYEWTTQIYISKKLKEFARKYDITIISPYQIDDQGGTRFAKGILDSPDIALLLDAHDKEDAVMTFDSTKVRGGPPIEFSSGINWDTLRINPADVPRPKAKSITKEKKQTKSENTQVEDSADLPW